MLFSNFNNRQPDINSLNLCLIKYSWAEIFTQPQKKEKTLKKISQFMTLSVYDFVKLEII